MRELRKLSESGHETAFLSTDYRAPAAVLARAMFGRWSQESMAYRAEAAMAQIVRQTTSRDDDARSLLRAVYSTEIDLIFDQKAKNPPTGHGLMTRP